MKMATKSSERYPAKTIYGIVCGIRHAVYGREIVPKR